MTDLSEAKRLGILRQVGDESPGFSEGLQQGFSMANNGAIKPKNEAIDAMARKSASENPTANANRGTYVHNWKAGFDWGWRKGK